MAKGQMRGNREKKKPKADKNGSKVATAVSPLAIGRFPGRAVSGAAGKKSS